MRAKGVFASIERRRRAPPPVLSIASTRVFPPRAALYQETGVVSLKDSPTPRYDLLTLDRYTTASISSRATRHGFRILHHLCIAVSCAFTVFPAVTF